MSYLELFKTISKPWASVNEIKLIANCGRDSAIKIRNDIQENIISQGKFLPSAKTIIVPMKYVIDYLGLDLSFIKDMAIYEANIINNDTHAINVIPEERPSSPSVKFIALVIPTIQIRSNPLETPIKDSIFSNLACPIISYTAPSTPTNIKRQNDKTCTTCTIISIINLIWEHTPSHWLLFLDAY